MLAAHRHVFGVLGWFSIFAALGLGPAGAVMYRMSEFVGRYWLYKSKALNAAGEGASPALQLAATQAWGVIDYLPARVTAVGFAKAIVQIVLLDIVFSFDSILTAVAISLLVKPSFK